MKKAPDPILRYNKKRRREAKAAIDDVIERLPLPVLEVLSTALQRGDVFLNLLKDGVP
jgi:hypothetical protein